MPCGRTTTRWAVPVAAGVALVWAATAPADVVYMKDGFTLHGKIRREAESIFDPVSGQSFTVFKGKAYTIIDDRVRLTVFPLKHVNDLDEAKSIHKDLEEYARPLGQRKLIPLPPAAKLDPAPQFDDHWDRTQILRNDKGKYTVKQRVTSVTPYVTRIEGHSYGWAINYLTGELPKSDMLALLEKNSDWAVAADAPPNAEKRLKRFRFCLQAGWTDEAARELDKYKVEFPAEAAKHQSALTSLRQVMAIDRWDAIEVAQRAGRAQWVRDALTKLPTNDLPAQLQTECAALRGKLSATDAQVSDARRLIAWQLDTAYGPWQSWLAVALATLDGELGPETAERLEPYLVLARQAEANFVASRPATHTHEQLFALAISGWLLGREAAEDKIEYAERLWAGRQMVQTYCGNGTAVERYRALESYKERPNPISLDELAQLIASAPPIHPDTGPRPAGQVLQRTTDLPAARRGPVNYAILPPAEYRPGRAYPMIVVLHATGETPADALARWGLNATKNGYFVVAPAWGGAPQGLAYSAEEHAPTLDVIQDVKRRWQVDGDRVFLTGVADGGTACYDLAFAHPDLFAGVVPVCASPRWIPSQWYWRNAQQLPFYSVSGEYAGDSTMKCRTIFDQMVERGYNAMLVVYKGRVTDTFPGEQPAIIDWMNRKRRATGFPELGSKPGTGYAGEEYITMRPEDDRFYWISVGGLVGKSINRELATKQGAPAGVQAVSREPNQISLFTRGVKTATIWLGRITDSQTGTRQMVDFSKPVRVDVKGRMVHNKVVTPDLGTMLEDYYQRNDKQRLFSAKIDLDNLPN